ncbi:MAG: Roadblock/LC7 domain protein [Candidatus Methanofastidiosum methylothiophilum]|uniref:Roadblock/LC7 domain protein n=1 Tax=Candidatus Methanofastidiosum methylothiophilum TaxID=1705564 RepID=A0A150J0X7_9EURY|nr:MAG: Roadblock/LC7 domain protein [Candidatus Methanofastidiosum methylthiophilus]KYC48235.1 MAG: Roadblock/LC7 domain protein [Candidatus Methanofastidiosum methylthiophilus]KYC50892.1 MAG: Roadblock/LC7 domain protein [Candidatus Methanofastidiosum methylthiophilus]
MREDILIKHLKNLTFENKMIKDAFIMGIDGLLIAVKEENDQNEGIAARMSGVIDAAKRIEGQIPESVSVITKDQKIITIPLSENFLIVLKGDKDLNSCSAIRLIEKKKQNILSMIEKREFSDLFSYRPAEVKGLDI